MSSKRTGSKESSTARHRDAHVWRWQEIDFGPLWKASRQAADWALDLAERHVKGDREDHARVKRARRYVYQRLAGNNPETPHEDLLFVAAVLIDALDLPCQIPGLLEAVEATMLGIVPADSGVDEVPLVRVEPAWPSQREPAYMAAHLRCPKASAAGCTSWPSFAARTFRRMRQTVRQGGG